MKGELPHERFKRKMREESKKRKSGAVPKVSKVRKQVVKAR
jgi:hypothetical protein